MPDREGDRVQVSVVIACRDAEEFLACQLEALAAQAWSGSWELVISDNGSTDSSIAIAEQFRSRFPRLVIVDSSDRPGPSAARNTGVCAARGDRLLFCDADDEVASGWLAAMATALEHHGLVGAHVDHDLLNEPSALRERVSQPGLLQSRPPFLPYTFGGALGVRRAVHDKIGGFDEAYRESGEDRDYCYRAQLSGVPLVFVPAAVIHYRHRTSVLDIYRQSRGYALGHVQIYRDYRHLGLKRPSLVKAAVHWALTPLRLLTALPSRRRFAEFMSRLGWRVGRVQGSLRYRVWAL